MNVGILSTTVTLATAGFNKGVKEVVNGFQKIGGVAMAINQSLEILKTAFRAFEGTVGKLSSGFIEAASTAEQYRVRLTVLLGSQKEANRLFAEMSVFAEKSVYEYKDIMGAATQLAGVMKGGINEVKAWMPVIADIAAATGLSIQDTTSQMVRMFSAGANSAELFSERGVLGMLGFVKGQEYSVKETIKTVIAAYESGTSKIRGASDALANTYTGLMGMLADKWFSFRIMVMEDGGLFEGLKAGIKSVVDELDRMKKSGDLQEWARKTAIGVINAVGIIGSSFIGLGQIIEGIIAKWNQLNLFLTKDKIKRIVNPELIDVDPASWIRGSLADNEKALADAKENLDIAKARPSIWGNVDHAQKAYDEQLKIVSEMRKELEEYNKALEDYNKGLSSAEETQAELAKWNVKWKEQVDFIRDAAKASQQLAQNQEQYNKAVMMENVMNSQLANASGLSDADARKQTADKAALTLEQTKALKDMQADAEKLKTTLGSIGLSELEAKTREIDSSFGEWLLKSEKLAKDNQPLVDQYKEILSIQKQIVSASMMDEWSRRMKEMSANTKAELSILEDRLSGKIGTFEAARRQAANQMINTNFEIEKQLGNTTAINIGRTIATGFDDGIKAGSTGQDLAVKMINTNFEIEKQFGNTTAINIGRTIATGFDAGIKAGSTGQDLAVKMAAAIKSIESGGSKDPYSLGHDGGTGYGAYGIQNANWKKWSTQYANENGIAAGPNGLERTPAYQDAVAIWRIMQLMKEGRTPPEIASIWNSGGPKWEGKVGVNSMGQAYNVPKYVDNFMSRIGSANNPIQGGGGISVDSSGIKLQAEKNNLLMQEKILLDQLAPLRDKLRDAEFQATTIGMTEKEKIVATLDNELKIMTAGLDKTSKAAIEAKAAIEELKSVALASKSAELDKEISNLTFQNSLIGLTDAQRLIAETNRETQLWSGTWDEISGKIKAVGELKMNALVASMQDAVAKAVSLKTAFTQVADGMKTAFTDFFMSFAETGKFAFGDLGAAMIKMLRMVAAKMAAESLMMALSNSVKAIIAMTSPGGMYDGVPASVYWGNAAKAAAAAPLYFGFIAGSGLAAGMAHDGIDSIPKTGTWLLQKGERVTDERTNKDLKTFLTTQNKDGGKPPLNMTVNINGGDEKSILKALPELKRIIVDTVHGDIMGNGSIRAAVVNYT